MMHLLDGDFKWILHVIDHWFKFNFAFSLKSKDAESVAATLKSYIFPYFGIPKIFHSYNGGQFVNHACDRKLDHILAQGYTDHAWQTTTPSNSRGD